MYIRMRQFAACMVTLATLCGLPQLPAASAQDVRPSGDADVQSAVLEAFRRRQEKVRAFRFEWKETTIAGESLKEADHQPRPKSAEEAAIYDIEKRFRVAYLVDKTYRLIVDDKRVRFDEDSTRRSRGEAETMVPYKRLAAYDGEVGTELTAQSSSEYPLGAIEAADLTSGFEFVGSIPLVLAYRGSDWTRAQFLASGQPLNVRSGVLGEVDCRILRSASTQTNPLAYEIWVDPARDFLVLRFVKYIDGKLTSKTDISYVEDAEHQWVPSAWKRSHWNTKQRLRFTVHAKVIDYAINPPIDASTFTIEFVPGTYVYDRRSKEQYIAREGGGKRIVLPSEWKAGATYEQLLNSETPGTRRISTLFVIVLSSLLIVVVVVLIVWRRFGKSSRASPTTS